MKKTINKIKHQAHQGMVWFKKQWVSAKSLASDGCTGIPDLGLTDCCEQHDADYTPESCISRLKADHNLMCCVWKKAKTTKEQDKKALYYVLSPILFIGVRLFGWPRYQKEK